MLLPRRLHDTSMPGTSRMPCARAASLASAQPSVVSWSVRASVLSPASTARCTTTDGASVPSLAVEWVCRSIATSPA